MPSLAGKFLVARPVLQDPNFARAVVLILQHGDEGAFGLVINRPVQAQEVPFPIFIGGPCKMEGMLLLHGHAEWLDDAQAGQVCPGVFLGDAACAERVSAADESDKLRFRMFSGYSGWGPNQLEGELGERAWAIAPATAAHVFETAVDELWTRVLPPSIPEPSMN